MIDTKVESFNQNRPLLFGIAWRMLGNAADAEDILQEASMKMRGVQKQGGDAITSALLGKFRDDHRTRFEFLTLVQNHSR